MILYNLTTEIYHILEQLILVSFLFVIVMIAYMDMRGYKITNKRNLILLCYLVPSIMWYPEIKLWERCIGVLFPSVILLIIAIITKGGIGGGDIKFMAVIGLLFGYKISIATLVIGVTG